eukprot:TRINITY_DN356_c0_g1_i1.p1 TRINITY_DN356_c0_g1~~TRINITY_DN356_c0_g1_i1.p1  ORF type:complete len:213 (-),score=41.87 TRINITY_DN356_c0_g1_i1:30-668(-)
MVFFFTCIGGPSYVMYMGRDKFENEELIRWGWPEDVWFHVDKLSSAHVYLRLPAGVTFDTIPEEVLQDCCQLVKANSIEGCKQKSVEIVYTPWSNLKKTAGMEVGQVSFHSNKMVRKMRVEKENMIVNRLNRTRVEVSNPNFQADRETRDKLERDRMNEDRRKREKEEAALRAERRREAELRSYDRLMNEDRMTSNKLMSSMSAEQYEEDFM